MGLVRSIAVVVAAVVGTGLVGPVASASGPEYYLALGDSLSVGVQAGTGPTDQGYTDRLHAALEARNPRLQLVKLGCPGETTTTMLQGGICRYAEGSQLKAAEAFLTTHAGHVRYVTLDIGANDTNGCLPGGSVDAGCAVRGAGSLVANLPQITARLRGAGGGGPAYAAMNYYNPGLASWVSGGKAAALASVPVVDTFNAYEHGVYLAAGFRVADVNGAFAGHDLTEVTAPPYGAVPRGVARICTWTYQCSDGDGHATAAGYQEIANAFLKVVPAVPTERAGVPGTA
ncbi:SGNH/GDSL hydrolase family protein [Actinomadura sp. NPDC048032]|uniref:SGNH/GDSL hydrolase family protein n=1 Tax=Actinomadura sp. NPDC048032 TaxID=3155747 RepID=UPI0033FA410A